MLTLLLLPTVGKLASRTRPSFPRCCRCLSSSSQQPPATFAFELEALRAAAQAYNSAPSKTLLPRVQSITPQQHQAMAKLRQKLLESDDPKVRSRAKRRASVLIPLCLREGEPSILFTVRSQKVSTHKGQVAFPGGHSEAGESAAATGVREAQEELGPELGPIHLVARAATVPAITGTLVTPIIALLERDTVAPQKPRPTHLPVVE